jgi:E3 ubiquitin-protein ligase RFWD2
VAYVRFMSRTELAAASVNSTITLWAWESMERLRAFTGHVNVANFAGMEVCRDYLACGSETSQVRAQRMRGAACMNG